MCSNTTGVNAKVCYTSRIIYKSYFMDLHNGETQRPYGWWSKYIDTLFIFIYIYTMIWMHISMFFSIINTKTINTKTNWVWINVKCVLFRLVLQDIYSILSTVTVFILTSCILTFGTFFHREMFLFINIFMNQLVFQFHGLGPVHLAQYIWPSPNAAYTRSMGYRAWYWDRYRCWV